MFLLIKMVFTIFLPSTPFVKWKKVSHMFRGGKYQNSYFKAKKKITGVCGMWVLLYS